LNAQVKNGRILTKAKEFSIYLMRSTRKDIANCEGPTQLQLEET